MTTPSTRPWRAVIRLEITGPDSASVVIPAWDHSQSILFTKSGIPLDIWKLAESGKIHFHALANIGAETADDIQLSAWETS